MKILSLSLFFLLAVATVSFAKPSRPSYIELLTSKNALEKEELSINYHNCRSWHLALETDNIRNMKTVPANCKDYVEDYLTTSKQYQADSKTVCKEAYFYAKGLTLKNNTANVFIFDLDDTILSSINFYAQYGYGTEPTPSYWYWLGKGETPGLPETLILWNNLLGLGIEPIIITERVETLERVTVKSLLAAGFTNWKHVIFKPVDSNDVPQVVYKAEVRKEILKNGYNVIGNIGDQWADLVEDTPGRTFKLPNPLYWVYN